MEAARDFEGFYAENFRALTIQLYAYCGNMTDAQEVVQEACYRALARWPKLSHYDDPAGWVRRVAWNLATSQWRQAKKHSEWAPEDGQTVSGPTPDRVDLVSALAKLPAPQRQAVVLHYLGDMSMAEIAEVSRVPAGTVKSWVSRARTVLSAQLSTKDDSDVIELGVSGRTRGDVEPFAGTGDRSTASPGELRLILGDPLADLFDEWAASLSL
ncbi:hypothetical protein Rhe02_07100 [Rhizocola hellebori]|uniref:SigE family RNA polymerase sigma factor n=1 Tax=Rhizocola hellebori TaxID=1392758 RepID=A0A8J3Q2G5_9ACTN|nr:SigE family RNA polymerase sigma factor [Rhizocola hellebori]GIH02643.1 hypothetical protein Rhe02_07100 [Rhizocola hellebori]